MAGIHNVSIVYYVLREYSLDCTIWGRKRRSIWIRVLQYSGPFTVGMQMRHDLRGSMQT